MHLLVVFGELLCYINMINSKLSLAECCYYSSCNYGYYCKKPNEGLASSLFYLPHNWVSGYIKQVCTILSNVPYHVAGLCD